MDHYTSIRCMIGTLAVDGCAVTFGTAKGGLRPRPVAVPDVRYCSPPINGQCTDFISFDVAL